MQVASLTVIEGVGTAGSGSIVARRLISERGKGKTVGIQERRSKAPWFVVPTWCRVRIFDVFLIGKLAVTQVQVSKER